MSLLPASVFKTGLDCARMPLHASTTSVLFSAFSVNSLQVFVARARRRPCYACVFSPCSDDRDWDCEKFVTELSAQPTSPIIHEIDGISLDL